MGEPGVGAFLGKEVSHVFDGFMRHDGGAVFSVEDWQRHAPGTLAGNYPVAPVLDHVVKAGLAPGRVEGGLFNLVQDLVSELGD